MDRAAAEDREKKLIVLAKQGDADAFGELIVQHEKIVYNVALRMLNHSEDAKDISQEVFLKVYHNIKNFDEKAAFSTWLYRITVNTCIDEIRKRKGKQNVSLEEEREKEDGSLKRQVADAGETPEESMLRREGRSEIMEALDAISEEYKTVIILRDVRGLSYEEVAEIIDLPLGTVKSRISRARNKLKKEILKIRERNGQMSRHTTGKGGRFHEV